MCLRPGFAHRKRKRDRKEWVREYRSKRNYIIGIDGEGQGRYPHLYTFLAASDADGKTWATEDITGLSTEACFEFLLSLPRNALLFAYAFNYDLTKILRDLPDEAIFNLFREERREFLRDGRYYVSPVRWRTYSLNLRGRKFSLRHGRRRVAVWDIFAFFSAKFTKALTDWSVTSKEEIDWIENMKAQRSTFDALSPILVKRYCFAECRYLAKLGASLLQAHDEAGLKLRAYHGSGSTATVLLRTLEIDKKRGEFPEPMRDAIARAFFGGRFENSIVGPVREKIYGYDIASAYPYQCFQLPCMECGAWKHVRDPSLGELERSTLAICHWHRDQWVRNPLDGPAWGLLPVRSEKGTIVFPAAADGGWCYQREFLAAQALDPEIVCREAWIYETRCDCQPFADIPRFYLERQKLGDDAAGIVLKLALNSVYGKLAQSKGRNPPFQSWIWAGAITSGTRGQLLQAIGAADDPWDILMFATDGVWSRRPLRFPKPIETGTGHTDKPLGSWTSETFENGVMAVRPGIYFPLDPTPDQLKKVRARGLGKKIVYERWREIVDFYEKGGRELTVTGISRFIGAKTGITYGEKENRFTRSKNFGEWIDHKVDVTFHPQPKRNAIRADNRLVVFPHLAFESEPYSKAVVSPEAEELRKAELIADEQPDGDFYDTDAWGE